MNSNQEAESNQKPIKIGQSNGKVNSQVECKIETLTINIFFDGTGNNMYNIQDYEKYQHHQYLKRKIPKGSSYTDSSFSNIALLFQCFKPKDQYNKSIYIQGIGTNNWRQEHPEITDEKKFKFDKDDSILGLAFGMGEYGVIARVKQAVDQLYLILKKHIVLINLFI